MIDDERISIWIMEGWDPSPMSDVGSPSFRLLEKTLRQTMPGDIVFAPYLVMGGTDARYYAARSSNVFRFLPLRFEEGDLGRVHGTDERVGMASYATAVKYVYQLIKNVEEL